MNITELKELAEKATPGPWFVVGQPWNPKADFIVAGSEDPHVGQYVADTEDFDGEGRNVQENAAYIAAANPAAILELIAKLEDAQGEMRALRATEAGLRDRLAQVEAEHAALLKAISDAEPVAWRNKDLGLTERFGTPIYSYFGEIDFMEASPDGKALLAKMTPLYTLNGIKKP